jgi:filamentous hemagglutinin
LKKLRGKNAHEIEQILKNECCAAAKANPAAEKPPYLPHIKGQAGEHFAWQNAIKQQGHIPIQAPGAVTATGADAISFDPTSQTIFVWDAKYRGPSGRAPTSISNEQLKSWMPEVAAAIQNLPDISNEQLKSWMPEVAAAIQNLPDGPQKSAILNAFSAGKVRGRIFQWP